MIQETLDPLAYATYEVIQRKDDQVIVEVVTSDRFRAYRLAGDKCRQGEDWDVRSYPSERYLRGT